MKRLTCGLGDTPEYELDSTVTNNEQLVSYNITNYLTIQSSNTQRHHRSQDQHDNMNFDNNYSVSTWDYHDTSN